MAKVLTRNVCFDGASKEKEALKAQMLGLRDEAQQAINLPFVVVGAGAMFGCYNEPSTVFISLSLEAKEDWQNGIYENSNYFRFSLDDTGKLELHNGQYEFHQAGIRFRKQTAKSFQDALARINKFVEQAKAFTAQGAA